MSYQAGKDDNSVDIKTLSSAVLERIRPFDSPYTGTHFGIFAQGKEGFLCADTAYFNHVSFEP